MNHRCNKYKFKCRQIMQKKDINIEENKKNEQNQSYDNCITTENEENQFYNDCFVIENENIRNKCLEKLRLREKDNNLNSLKRIHEHVKVIINNNKSKISSFCKGYFIKNDKVGGTFNVDVIEDENIVHDIKHLYDCESPELGPLFTKADKYENKYKIIHNNESYSLLGDYYHGGYRYSGAYTIMIEVSCKNLHKLFN